MTMNIIKRYAAKVPREIIAATVISSVLALCIAIAYARGKADGIELMRKSFMRAAIDGAVGANMSQLFGHPEIVVLIEEPADELDEEAETVH